MTSTELVLAGSQASTALRDGTLSDDQLALIKDTICHPKHRDASEAELALFIGQCQRTGLDPFANQIYAIFRKERSANNRERMTIQTGIDGFRLVAERTNQYAGQSEPLWLDAEGRWHEAWVSTEQRPVTAKIVVKKYIGGQIIETPAVANFHEFAPTFGDGKLGGLWPQMPAHMIAKCAEALALRKGFPQKLSGIYTDDEMSVADFREEAIDTGATDVVARPALAPAPEPLITRKDHDELVAAAGDLSAGKLRLIFGSLGLDAEQPWIQVPKSKVAELAMAMAEARR